MEVTKWLKPSVKRVTNGVWIAYPITFVAMLVLQGLYYQVVWRKKKVVRMV